MDEQKLADLFRDAVHDAPPASFDASDVRTASRRATLRRRNSIAAGTTLVVVLGFGGVVAGTNWINQDKSTSSNLGSGQANDNKAESPLTGPATALEAQPPQKDFPGDPSTQGDGSTPGSTGLSTSDRAVQGCAGVDRELADALAGELSVSPEHAQPPTVTCSPDSRSAAFKIDGLTITAIVTQKAFEAPAGAEKVRTAKGQDLYVFTQGDGELKGQAKRFADALAPKF
ncbi:hypothetical protein [Lentzea flava]|uniref:DUF3558 domain-containing protein n=1 Tax=Lentzea flava TaxID=103732 RepID=A0ABQ2V563_9PSEU|nr:hypothetical protein [Lentzea flava]MCP2203568.1 hypothetical protein [Lentzea flava]GGU69347.1 hypothetical protein GCM10010178_71430 [Lentzea flava]